MGKKGGQILHRGREKSRGGNERFPGRKWEGSKKESNPLQVLQHPRPIVQGRILKGGNTERIRTEKPKR